MKNTARTTLALFASLLTVDLASAQDESSAALAPGIPSIQSLPGGVTPAFGQPSAGEDWRFIFDGTLSLPLRYGLNTREEVAPGQSELVLHAPPRTPDKRDSFSFVGIDPEPFVQTNFSYGNSRVMSTIVMTAESVASADGFYNPPDHLKIHDAFVTVSPDPFENGGAVSVSVGAFTQRYGSTGEYDEGIYGTPIIARIEGGGYGASLALPLGEHFSFHATQGVMGQLTQPTFDLGPSTDPDADPLVGTSFAHHASVGLRYNRWLQVGGYFAQGMSRDDRATPTGQPDGTITVMGGDVRASTGRYGYFYVGGSYTDANNSRNVGDVIRVLNTSGGPGLMRHYLGQDSNGTGQLISAAAQYNFSFARFMFPDLFTGDSQDIVFSAFGQATQVSSAQEEFDGVLKFKYGAEATYSVLSWLHPSIRYDRVAPDQSNDFRTWAALSPRLIFKTDYNSRDQIVLQYTRYFYGSGVVVQNDQLPAELDPTIDPDDQVVSLTARMWW